MADINDLIDEIDVLSAELESAADRLQAHLEISELEDQLVA